MGDFEQIHDANLEAGLGYDFGLYSFVRWSDKEKLIIVTNFNQNTTVKCPVILPAGVVKKMNLKEGSYKMKDQLYLKNASELIIKNGVGKFSIEIQPGESFIYKL